jgi:hypothetical protein
MITFFPFLLTLFSVAQALNTNLFKSLLNTGTAKKSVEVSVIKQKLLSISKGTGNGIKAPVQVQSEVQNLVDTLTGSHKIRSKEFDSLMEGTWKLAYTTNREFSAGKVGPFIGSVLQTIDAKNLVYYNNLSVFNGLLKATLEGTWEVSVVCHTTSLPSCSCISTWMI